MRIDLEMIKKIEAYLTATMDAKDLLAFEQEISTNPELKNAVEQQRNLMKVMEKTFVENKAHRARKIYTRNVILKRLLILMIILMILVPVGLVVFKSMLRNPPKPKAASDQADMRTESEYPRATPAESIPSDSLKVDSAYSSSKVKINFRRKDHRAKEMWLKGDSTSIDTTSKNLVITDTVMDLKDTSNTEAEKDKTYYIPENKTPQTFIVNPKNKITITGKDGTIIKFYENSFVDRKGNVLKQDIRIELTEVRTKYDMIEFGIQTLASRKLLESSGMIYIKAYLGNEEVLLAKDMFFQVEFPLVDREYSKTDDMSMFYADSITGPTNWSAATRNFFSDMTYIENRDNLNKYIFNSTKLGWINCDRFIEGSNNTQLTVDLSDTSSVNVCLVFMNLNSVMNISDKANGKIHFNRIPVGEEATVIAFKKDGDNMYFSSETITIEKFHKTSLVMTKITEADFKNRIKKFN
jgi:hypothetical protein